MNKYCHMYIQKEEKKDNKKEKKTRTHLDLRILALTLNTPALPDTTNKSINTSLIRDIR